MVSSKKKSVGEDHIANPILFYYQFTAKQLNRQAAKAGKDETAEKNKLKKVRPPIPPSPPLPKNLHILRPPANHPSFTQAIQQNHPDIAKIYAQNAIRKQNEKLNLLRLGSRIDAVASRVQTAVTMRQVTGSMAGVVRGMEGAMKAMDLEKVSERDSSRKGKKEEEKRQTPTLLPFPSQACLIPIPLMLIE